MYDAHASSQRSHSLAAHGLAGRSIGINGALWFFTGRSTDKAQEIAQNPSVSLLFQSDSDSTYLHFKELYTPIIKTWFPNGVNDPDLTLIRFEAKAGISGTA